MLGRIDAPSETLERVLERMHAELAKNFMHVIEECVRITCGFTRPRGKIDRTKMPQEVLDALKGMVQEVDPEALETMPGRNPGNTNQNPDEGDFHFFQIEKDMTDDEVMPLFESRGLRPADAYELGWLNATLNAKEDCFTYRYPNATIWRQEDGTWCFMACYVHLGTPYVRVKPHVTRWRKGYWMVGTPKSA